MSTKFETILKAAFSREQIHADKAKEIIFNICKEHAGMFLTIPKKPIVEKRNERIRGMVGTTFEIAEQANLSDRQVRRIRGKG